MRPGEVFSLRRSVVCHDIMSRICDNEYQSLQSKPPRIERESGASPCQAPATPTNVPAGVSISDILFSDALSGKLICEAFDPHNIQTCVGYISETCT